MFSIVICTMANQPLLDRVLKVFLADSLAKQIVIVDNNSYDGTAQYLQSINSDKLVVITNNQNNGVIKARNQGLALATSHYTLVIDDDQIPSHDTLSRYSDALEKYSIVGCEAQIMDFTTGLTKLGDKNNFTYVGAGGMCASTNLWRDVGLFDEIFQPAYFEDPDFCLKAKNKGYTIGLVENHGITHIAHRTLFRNDLGFNHSDVCVRNRKIFMARYGVETVRKRVVVANNAKRTKILFVLRNVNVGGVQKNTLDIVSNLSQEEYEFAVFVADSSKEGDLSGELSQYAKIFYNKPVKSLKEIRVYKNIGTKVQVVSDRLGNSEIVKPGGCVADDRFPNLQITPSFRLFEVKKLQNMQVEDAVKAFSPDIIHYQRDLSKISSRLLTMKKDKRFKILRSVHSSANPTNVTGYDKIILLTRSGLSKMTRNFKGVSAGLIHNGVDIEMFKSLDVPKKNIIFTHTRLAKLLKMTHRKDFYFTVARAVLERTGFVYKFVVMGADKSKYLNELMQKAQEVGIEKNFVVEDALYGKDLVKYINSCLVWFYPTSKDCFPLSVLEAMGCGVPVVASDLRGIREMISNEDHGLISPCSVEEQFIQNIIKILHNQEYGRKLGQNARRRIEKMFSVENMISKYDKLYKSLA